MSTRASKAATSANEISAIEELVGDLERRLHRLSETGDAGRGELADDAGEISDFVRKTLDDITNRVRKTAANVGQSVANGASRFGSDTARKIADEVDQKPFTMLAVAAGIGFLVGFANRR